MRRLFADSFYFIALLDRADQWHRRVQIGAARLKDVPIVTTEEGLVEVLAALSIGRERRRIAVAAVHDLMSDPLAEVVPQSHASFMSGIQLYASRRDKEYSLTD